MTQDGGGHFFVLRVYKKISLDEKWIRTAQDLFRLQSAYGDSSIASTSPSLPEGKTILPGRSKLNISDMGDPA